MLKNASFAARTHGHDAREVRGGVDASRPLLLAYVSRPERAPTSREIPARLRVLRSTLTLKTYLLVDLHWETIVCTPKQVGSMGLNDLNLV